MTEPVLIEELKHHFPQDEGTHSLLSDYVWKYAQHFTPNPGITHAEAAQIQALWRQNVGNVLSSFYDYVSRVAGVFPNPPPAYKEEIQPQMWKIWRADTAKVLKVCYFYLEVIPIGPSGLQVNVYMYQKKSGSIFKHYIFMVRKGDTGAQWVFLPLKTARSVEEPEHLISLTPEQINDINKLADDLEDQNKFPDDSTPEPTPIPTPAPNPAPNPTPTPRPSRPLGILPPNVSSGFGGVDASCAAFSMEGFKPNLFNLDISDPTRTWSFESTGTDGKTTYVLPNYLNFTWTTIDDFFSATGSSKKEFIRDLSGHLNLGISILGFGAEFKRTFSEESKEETFTKYLARYDTSLVYRVGFKDPDTARNYLSADAKAALATWEPLKFVQVFGTHYMTEACFGGMRIHSSTLDTLDTFTKSDLKDAIDITIPLKDDSGKDLGKITSDGSDREKTTLTIAENMQTLKIRTIGGTAPDEAGGLQSWRQSLHSNPALVKYKLNTIDNLVTDAERKAKFLEAINVYLKTNQPIDGCSILAIRVPLKTYYSDADSGGQHDLSVAYPDVPEGWLRLGQFAQGVKSEWAFKGTNYGVAVKINPNLTLDGRCPNPPVMPATTAESKWALWRHSTAFGFYTPIYDPVDNSTILNDMLDKKTPLRDQYAAIGDIFEPATELKYLHGLDKIACFHKDCMVEVSGVKGTWIWDDAGTDGPTDIAVLGAPPAYAGTGSTKPQPLVVKSSQTSDGYAFKCLARGTDWTKLTWHMPDWSKVKWLENRWLANM